MSVSEGIFARALRSSALTAGSYAITQVLRLGSNLILTRLLFPEAFGLMALVTVVMVGLTMFSDIGLGPAIAAHPRGDDEALLDTAFSLNVMRGAILWLLTAAAALPVSWLYHAPELAQILPVAGLSLLISGFTPIRVETANRHLLLGRVTALDLAAQIIGILAMVGLALVLRSVWALVIGALIGSLARVLAMRYFLPGRPSRFALDKVAAGELIHFGKWIFLSTACGFVLSQGDKAIFGAYLSLQDLGIYNIGFFLAAFPMLMAGAVSGRIMIPIYRDRPPQASAQNARRLRQLRLGLTGGTLALLALMGLIGPWLVGVMYDARYGGAAAVVVAISLVQMPAAIGMSYDQAALARGDSKGYFALIALKAVVQSMALLLGMHYGGLMGALAAQGLALALLHLAIIRLARRHLAWDFGHDLGFGLVALCLGLLVWTAHSALLLP